MRKPAVVTCHNGPVSQSPATNKYSVPQTYEKGIELTPAFCTKSTLLSQNEYSGAVTKKSTRVFNGTKQLPDNRHLID